MTIILSDFINRTCITFGWELGNELCNSESAGCQSLGVAMVTMASFEWGKDSLYVLLPINMLRRPWCLFYVACAALLQ